jgi:hypothetical protein
MTKSSNKICYVYIFTSYMLTKSFEKKNQLLCGYVKKLYLVLK